MRLAKSSFLLESALDRSKKRRFADYVISLVVKTSGTIRGSKGGFFEWLKFQLRKVRNLKELCGVSRRNTKKQGFFDK